MDNILAHNDVSIAENVVEVMKNSSLVTKSSFKTWLVNWKAELSHKNTKKIYEPLF